MIESLRTHKNVDLTAETKN